MKMVRPGIGVSFEDAEKLRTANVTMKDELTGLYAQNSALHAENAVLKARLAVYELPGMDAPRITAWTAEPRTDAQAAATEKLRKEWVAKHEKELRGAKKSAKMPWEGG
jgi:hypothetical protein